MFCSESDRILASASPRNEDNGDEIKSSDQCRTNNGLDETVQLRNSNLKHMKADFLYHLALSTEIHDLEEMFGNVKFVCMGGTGQRMEILAHYLMKEIDYKLPTGASLQDLSAKSCRYSMYKVGPVLCVSHGMGPASISILLHEVFKLMYHAKCRNPIFFRIGTCGGIGVEAGTVIVTEKAFDASLRNSHEFVILGKSVHRPAFVDQEIVQELKSLALNDDPFKTISGNTLCTSDFYEGQGRLDGAICEFSKQDKMDYLQFLHNMGIRNIEMECSLFAALTHHVGIKSAIICVALVNRLETDQVTVPKEVSNEWQLRPTKLVSRYMRKILKIESKLCNKNANNDCQ